MGRKMIFDDPKIVEDKIKNYFDKRKTEFNYKYDVVKSGQNAGDELKIKVAKPPTIKSLCSHIGCSEQTFKNYCKLYTEKINDIDVLEDCELPKDYQIYRLFARAYDRILDDIQVGGLSGVYDPGLAKTMTGLTDTLTIDNKVTVNTLPIHVGNNIIDLTDSEYSVLSPVKASLSE